MTRPSGHGERRNKSKKFMNQFKTQPDLSGRPRRYVVVGARRTSNVVLALTSLLGGCGFVAAGLGSRRDVPNLPWIGGTPDHFFPQGLIMVFYGLLGLTLAAYVTLTMIWGVGGGVNIFDKQRAYVRIFRWGYPGKHRKIDITVPLSEVSAVRLALGSGGAPSARARRLYLCASGNREIPLTRFGEPASLETVEKLASELAQYLGVDLLS